MNIENILNSIQELKKADKIKVIDFGDVKINIKVITTEDEIASHLFAKEFSEKYPEKERGYVYVQKLKQEVAIRSITQINDVKFQYDNNEEKERIITSLRTVIKELGESITQIIYDFHNELMTSYKDDFDIEIEKEVEEIIKKEEETKENIKLDDDNKQNIELKIKDIQKSKEEIEKNNQIIENEFESKIEDGKVVVTAKKDIAEIKKELEKKVSK